MGFCIIHARMIVLRFSRMKFDERFPWKKYLKKYSWNLNLYMFKQVWNCSRESFVMMFSWNEKSGIGVWKIIFLYRQSNEKKILLRDYYYIVQIFVYTMAYLAIGNFSRKEFIVIRREKMAICNLFGSRFECNKY